VVAASTGCPTHEELSVRDFIGIDLAGRQEMIISFRHDEELF
jgi:hypothetical protein